MNKSKIDDPLRALREADNDVDSTGKIKPYRLIIEGMGSIMNLYPDAPRAADFIITDPAKRMQYTWQRVGSSMWRAIDEYQTTAER